MTDMPAKRTNLPSESSPLAGGSPSAEPSISPATAAPQSPNVLHPDPAPFGVVTAGPVRRALRLVAFVAVVGIAVAVAFVTTRGREAEGAPAGHDHAAVVAAEAMPVSLDAESSRRIGVSYAEVTEGPMSADVRTTGQITYDETRMKTIAPKVDGWVEQLFVNFTGQEVREGDPIMTIYSPMLVTAQEELLLAARLQREVAEGSPDARRSAEALLGAARRRLLYWDIPAEDVERIERTGEVTRTLTLRSPVHGAVVEKAVVGGQRIMAGESLYRIADLSTIWVEGQVFELDLARARLGARVSVEIEAYPGEQWNGVVTYLYPVVDPTTRTARVRIALANPRLRLKPGMFATIRFPGALRARTLTVPRSAVLATGERTLVFVKGSSGQLEPREVVTGAANDDRIEILRGLQAGDTVVASATFLVDAESNLQSALGGMGNMPGMDMGPAKTPRKDSVPKAMPDMPGMDMSPGKTVPKKDTIGAPVDHSKHGGQDAGRRRPE